MDCSQMSYRAGLQQLSSAAQSLKSSAYTALCKAGKQPLSQSTVQDVPIAPPSLVLPLPDHITPVLIDAGCSALAAQALSDAFFRSAREIRASYESTFHQACKRMAHAPTIDVDTLSIRLKTLGSALEHQYEDRIRAAQQLTLSRVHFAQQPLHAPSHRRKSTFNQEFVPLLEKYFEYNAYPSAPDRAALARKSMMTPRQIEVWFQNHRNRAKKEGKALRRLSTDPLPFQLSLESLEKKMPFFIIPPDERQNVLVEISESDSSDDEVEEPFKHASGVASSFTDVAPAHAFPTTYSPSCEYVPFPCQTRKYTFSAPVWMRTPATSCPTRLTVNFDDFVTDFAAKLVFREAKQPGKSSNTISSRPWYSATHTTTPSAPHPAFIRPRASPLTTSRSLDLLPTVPAPLARRHPFRSPSPFSPLISMVPLVQGDGPARHKVARLPKHTPRNESLAHRSASPASSMGSPSLSSSRTPSLSSITSSSRCPSSSSSSSSSSGPSTPTSSPTSFAKHIQLPDVSVPQWDSQIKGDLFGKSVNPSSAVIGYGTAERLFNNDGGPSPDSA